MEIWVTKHQVNLNHIFNSTEMEVNFPQHLSQFLFFFSKSSGAKQFFFVQGGGASVNLLCSERQRERRSSGLFSANLTAACERIVHTSTLNTSTLAIGRQRGAGGWERGAQAGVWWERMGSMGGWRCQCAFLQLSKMPAWILFHWSRIGIQKLCA